MSRRSKQQTSSSNCVGCSSTSNLNNFNDDDRQQLYEIHSTVKSLAEDLKSLKEELEISKNEVKQVKAENVRLKQALNMTIYKLDELEQYGRRENLRIHEIQESLYNKDDGKDIVLNIAKILGIERNESDIQKAHRLGKKKRVQLLSLVQLSRDLCATKREVSSYMLKRN